jgi:hypothetical protein
MSDDHKTIVNIKIRGNRTLKDLWLFSKLFSAFLFFLICIGLIQVKLCRDKDENKPWVECLISKGK